MTRYEITIKTGDIYGAGTNATVRIILHGKGKKTEEFELDNACINDFERNQVDKFFVESQTNILEVDRIELWRNSDFFFGNWFVDYIEVTNLVSKIKTIFPAMKWIRENERYFIKHIDTCLPQDEPFKEHRALELKEIQQKYLLEVKIPGGTAQLKELPDDEKFSFQYQSNVLSKIKKFQEESKKQIQEKGIQWKSVEDVMGSYTGVFPIPKGSTNFNDDASFGRQRLSCLNSTVLKLCTEIPEKFGVTEKMIGSLLEGKSIQQAIDMKRMFMVDYEILEGVPTKAPELLVPAPIALFYFNDKNRLMPVAIQLYQQKATDNPVFLPTDPEYTWMLAKMWFNLADSTYHQSLAHLTLTHLMLEGIAVSCNRQLSSSHPIFKLLKPHFHYLFPINALGLVTLIKPGGFFDRTSNGGTNAFLFLMKKGLEFWRLDVHGNFPENLKSRQVYDGSVLTGAYHVRDDGLLIYDAIRTYVDKYVRHYYAKDGSLVADYELQAWGEEIVRPRDEGGVGTLGVPNNGRFETVETLIVTLTAIIYTCSVAHAAANFQQYDEYGAPFNYPYTMYGTPPKNKDPLTLDDVLKSIGNRVDVLSLMSITFVLSEKATQSLGDFEKQFIVDPPAMKIVEEFREELRGVQKTIEERNSIREAPYNYLEPNGIPNGISI